MRFRLFVTDEYKPLRTVPWVMWVLTIGAFSTQIAFQLLVVPPPKIEMTHYENPPSETAFRIAAFGEPEVLAKLLVMRLQAFDNQPGVSIPFRELDYELLGLWLDRAVALDERAEYPHFLMSKVYSAVSDDMRRYQTAAWVRRQFLRMPASRWEWMGQATNMVMYVLEDEELALEMARDLREHTPPGAGAEWVRQIEVFWLENKNEFEAAATILFNQLEAGEVHDPQEFAFLLERLEGMIETIYERGEIRNRAQWDEKIRVLDELKEKFLQQFEDE